MSMCTVCFPASVRRKFKAPEENGRESGEKTQTKPQLNQVSQVPDEEMMNKEEVTYASVQNKATTKGSQVAVQLNQVPQPDEEVLDKGGVIYASVCIKPNKPTERRVHAEQQEQDDSVIYSAVKKA
ncbi:hypothetical protein PHYPO_G00124700 [Pangasianodon hypophthalmus]|uniref:Uncharacterized protein n=1 Tax=Pangasianodon hypophthalmus TaxID=310915 RepID=A0A5N5KR38_PANHP|nr:hypothetical protein PHYPO_G00124700 [Pangasianodon hypophthalmus]